ncbi:hypothetical protein Peur_051787 [Populus x canadensis]
MGLCEELSQLCELLYNADLQTYRGLSNVCLQAYVLCNADIQAYADHAMTEELNVKSTSVYPTNDSLQWLGQVTQQLNAIDVHMKLDYVKPFLWLSMVEPAWFEHKKPIHGS